MGIKVITDNQASNKIPQTFEPQKSFLSAEVIFVMREPLLAGILSLLVPGLGQIYNGQIIWGLLWLFLTGFSWIGSAGTLGWVVHLIAAYFAYSYAKENPHRRESL